MTDHEVEIEYLKRDIKALNQKVEGLRSQYISKAEYAPVQKLVYGVTGLILTATILALFALLIKQ